MFRFESDEEVKTAAIISILAIAFVSLIIPFLTFWLSYVGGYFVKWTIGKILVQGFALFNINLPIEKIPLACGTLGFISSYFKEIKTNSQASK